MKQIRYAIKKRRKKLGLTLEGLAMISGSSKSYIWELESGMVRPSINKIVDIAKALHCTVGFLLGEEKTTGDMEAKHLAKQLINALKAWTDE